MQDKHASLLISSEGKKHCNILQHNINVSTVNKSSTKYDTGPLHPHKEMLWTFNCH